MAPMSRVTAKIVLKVRLAGVGTRYADDRDDSIAIQEALNGKPVDWMEKVSDEQYQEESRK
jgi:hypothetical protein